MKYFDVFNGDADGICALHQLRLAAPADAVLVTGVKRDIALLRRVDAGAGDVVTVLDVSADVNRAELVSLLQRGARVRYFDHHFAGDLPAHPNLRAHIDTSAETCTSLLVDQHLHGLHSLWAIAGAYGDNLARPAELYADKLGLDEAQRGRLRELGENLAYNAYGDHEADLVVHPAELYRALMAYVDPFAFMRDAPICRRLSGQKHADLRLAALAKPEFELAGAIIYILPDTAWARRVRGMMSNELANRNADLAHAVLTPDGEGGYTVSVRAPQASPSGADALCRRFPTGGGRLAAGGINHLPQDALPRFVSEMDRAFPDPPGNRSWQGVKR
jgi:hypothetical protein